MDLVLFEDRIKYDVWIKIALVFPIILFIAMGISFYIDAHYSDVFPDESPAESDFGAVILFASVPFVLVVYWLFLPRKVYVLQDKIKIKLGQFYLKVGFDNLESVKPARGIIVFSSFSSITSFSTQIEIIRKRGLNWRISPSRRDQFIEYVERAMSDWKRIRGL
jgi:hypothetical protein